MHSQERLLTTQQAAEILGLSVSTVKRLVETRTITAVKTPGGHRRITESAVMDYAQSKGIKSQELTAEPRREMVTSGQLKPIDESIEYWRSALRSALLQSHVDEARHAVRTVYASSPDAASLADNLISPVMAGIGHSWREGAIEIFQEHHACHLLSDILYELVRQARGRNRRNEFVKKVPRAIGATPEGDHYTLAGMLCELALLELGWEVRNLGCHLPLIELSQAVIELNPSIAWMSVNHVQDAEVFLKDFRLMRETCRSMKTTLIVGGQGLTPWLREEICAMGVQIADQLKVLSDTAVSIFPEGRRAIGSEGQYHQDLHKTR